MSKFLKNKKISNDKIKNIDINNLKDKIKNESSKNYLKSKDMNFFERYEVVVEGKATKIDPKFFAAPAIGIAGVIVLIIVIVNIMSAVTVNSNKKIQAYINDSKNVASYNQAVQLSSEISKRNSSKTAIDNVLLTMEKYPSLDKKFISTIHDSLVEGVKINTINYNSTQGYLSISCTSTDVQAIHVFVKALKYSNDFSLVTYTGYDGGSGGYSFTVSCICKGN